MGVRSLVDSLTVKFPALTPVLFNFYAPFFGAGIKVKSVTPDFHYMRVELPLTWYNRNYVGTAFGGSIYAMTDPFYMVMLIRILGRDYIVWDKGAVIDFVHPGRSRLIVQYDWTEEEIASIRAHTRTGEKYVFDKEVLVHDDKGELIARVIKTLYVRKKDPAASRAKSV